MARPARPGIAYWGMIVSESDEGMRVHDFVAPEDFTVTWAGFAAALGIMAGGTFIDHDGKPVPLTAYHVGGARAALTNDMDGDWDADTMDTAMQLATHGKLIYG
jgi:hypothetical protein